MSKLIFVLISIYCTSAVVGQIIISADLSILENDASKSLANAHNEGSTSIIEPILMDKDSEADSSEYGSAEVFPYSTRCTKGYSFDGGDCIPCPPGTYWTRGQCVPCKSGTYSSVEASTKCLPCTGGSVAPKPGSTKCKPCGRLGLTYDGINCVYPTRAPMSPKPSSSPTLKPATQIPTAAPSSAPTCSVGYLHDGANCIPCPPGTYWTPCQCVPCSIGTSNPDEAEVKCEPCYRGTYAPVPGLASCRECRRPFYSPDGIRCIAPEMPTGAPTQFGECRRGWAHIGGVCTRCLAGTYWTPNDCVPCLPGTFSSYEAHLCYACGDRSIAPLPGSTYCTPCDSQSYTLDSITCIPISAPSNIPTLSPVNPPPWWCRTFGCEEAAES